MKITDKQHAIYIVVLSFIFLISCQSTPSSLYDITSHLTEAENLIAEKSYTDAILILEEVIKHDPKAIEPRHKLAEIYLVQYRWELAQRRFNEILNIDSNNQAAKLGLAESLLQQGKPTESINWWHNVIEHDSESMEAWLGLGRAYMARRKYSRAEATFLTPLESSGMQTLKFLHSESGRQILWYLSALTLPADLSKGQTYLNNLDSPQANYLKETIAPFTTETHQAEVAKIIGIALIQLGEWELADNALNIATTYNSTDADAWAFFGYTKVNLGLPAMESFNHARKLDPAIALTPYFEGIYFRRQGLPDLAIDRFLEALDYDPNNLGIAMEAAFTLAETGNYISAEAWYQAIVKLEPESVTSQQQLTMFYVERSYHVLEHGLPAAERLLEMERDNPQAYNLLGWAKFQTGDYVGAEIELRKALELAPYDVSIRYHLGRVLKAQRRDVEAEQEFKHAIDWDISGVYRNYVFNIRR